MRIVFMGTPEFAVPSLEALLKAGHEIVLVVTQPDRPKGRKKTLTPPPVKEAALLHGLAVAQPEKLRSSTTVDQITASSARFNCNCCLWSNFAEGGP